ncbi:hypothetical protein COCOBI_02-1620 [Coccomyxa sp. Obi]|nr:hypothetical protein COCOBI_02-1620 [Coccomyxa sp. Obi]
MRIQCNIEGKWIWAKTIWQGQNVTLCKIESTWFNKPHPASRWCKSITASSCYACLYNKHTPCHMDTNYPEPPKHDRQGLKVANSQDDNGRSVLVGGWWGAAANTNPFVAQPATLSVDAQGLTLSACITHARYSSGAPVLDSATGEFVGIMKGDIKNDNIAKNGRQEIISAQEVHKIPWEVAGKYMRLLSRGESSLSAVKWSTHWAPAAPVKPVVEE